jgi:hypothetical protein
MLVSFGDWTKTCSSVSVVGLVAGVAFQRETMWTEVAESTMRLYWMYRVPVVG